MATFTRHWDHCRTEHWAVSTLGTLPPGSHMESGDGGCQAENQKAKERVTTGHDCQKSGFINAEAGADRQDNGSSAAPGRGEKLQARYGAARCGPGVSIAAAASLRGRRAEAAPRSPAGGASGSLGQPVMRTSPRRPRRRARISSGRMAMSCSCTSISTICSLVRTSGRSHWRDSSRSWRNASRGPAASW